MPGETSFIGHFSCGNIHFSPVSSWVLNRFMYFFKIK